MPFRAIEDAVHGLFGKSHGQHAVANRVVPENVGKRRRDHDAKSGIEQRPGRVLTRGPASEICPRNQDRRPGVLRPIERECRVEVAAAAPPIVEEKWTKPRPLDPLEKLLRDDLIGVHIGPVHRRDQSGMFDERFHGGANLSLLR